MSKTPSDQKRGAFRLTANVDARFTPVTIDTRKPVSEYIPLENWLHGSINDLSITGIRLTGPLSIVETQYVAVIFTFPSKFLREFINEQTFKDTGPFAERTTIIQKQESDFQEMEVFGKVIKEAYSPELMNFQYHVAFIDLPKEIEQEIARFVTLSQRYQLKHRNHIR